MALDFSKYGTPVQAPASSGGLDFAKYGAPAGPSVGPAPAPQPGIVSDLVHSIPDAIHGGVDQITKGAGEIANGESPIAAGESALKIGSGIASVLQSPLAPLFYHVGKAIGAVADKVGDIPQVQQFAASDAGKGTARVAEDLANAGNIAGTIAGAGKGVQEAPTVAGFADKAAGDLSKVPGSLGLAPKLPDAAIVDHFNKAIKPTTAGKTGPGQLDTYHENVVSAVKTIADNKTNLRFEDPAGTVVEGELPHTRGELADAVGQTKKVIFSQYDALAKKTGDMGAQISLHPAVSALDEVLNNQALQITNPEAIAYAKRIQQNLQQPDGTPKIVDPETAQQVIANWNSSLKAFYRNPTYESASRAAIDAGVVTEVRKSLDDTIENATGEHYQAIKKQYGALSAIEKDVNKAALAQAKQTGTNTSGLGKYVDVFSGGDMASGLLSLNPALFAKGAAQAGISHFFQWFNSPDRAVGSMFSAAEAGKKSL